MLSARYIQALRQATGFGISPEVGRLSVHELPYELSDRHLQSANWLLPDARKSAIIATRIGSALSELTSAKESEQDPRYRRYE